jgi:hypothetical protein
VAKKKSRKTTTKISDLPVRKGADVKGGSATSRRHRDAQISCAIPDA